MRREVKEIEHGDGFDIHIVGGPRPDMRDLYHALLRVPWWGAMLVIIAAYVLLNALFATLYMGSGGIANAEGNFLDSFFFSVQTMGTVGYGTMYPQTRLANFIVVAESIVGLLVTAVATGLVFVRFSHVRPRVAFSEKIGISPVDGVPTLMVRIGNERRNGIVDVVFRVTLMRRTKTAEGVHIFRASDLVLVRNRAPVLNRSWMIMSRIEPGSSLHDYTPERFLAEDVTLTFEVSGTDDTSLQPVHARCVYAARNVVFGARLADVLSELPDGNVKLDLARFHDLVPTAPTDAFPYPVIPS